MNEFDLIDQIKPLLPLNNTVIVGAGDDCAVLAQAAGQDYLLFKTDSVVQGVHFTEEEDLLRVGRKALARCMSDLAAMGGSPQWALVTLGLPEITDVQPICRIYEGMKSLAEKYDLAIVGGETTHCPDRLWISVAMVGRVAKSACILRNGAKPGDAVFVSGELGGSQAGKHLDFEPRLLEAQWLTKRFNIRSMIDVSDGLAGDLRHIMKQSGVGAELHSAAIPISADARRLARSSDTRTPLSSALSDGEDFELLFTVSAKEAVALLDAWKKQFPDLQLKCIGKIIQSPVLRLVTPEGVREIHADGYLHFK